MLKLLVHHMQPNFAMYISAHHEYVELYISFWFSFRPSSVIFSVCCDNAVLLVWLGLGHNHNSVRVWERSRFGLKRNSRQNATWAFFCECKWVKPLCKGIITKEEAHLRFTPFLFSGQTHFQWECYGHFYASIKIAIFKTLRRLKRAHVSSYLFR